MVGASAPPQSLQDLLAELNRIADQPLEEVEKVKKEQPLARHPMRQALYEVLCDQKQKTVLDQRSCTEDLGDDPQLARLDTMLAAEGVTGPERPASIPGDGPGEQTDYRQKLSKIRSLYATQLQDYSEHCRDFTKHTLALLEDQRKIRPISTVETERMVSIIQKKFRRIEIHLKDLICEQVMTMKNRFCDARRKRRNFTKQATEILQNYFRENIQNPYPTEEVKEMLARQCNITVSQVSNWFGNKRIRYKKGIAKNQEEAHMQAKRAAVGQGLMPMPGIPAAANYGMLGAPAMFPPYPGMLPPPDFSHMATMGMGGLGMDFSAYNPQLMAQYQQASQLQPPQNTSLSPDEKPGI